MKSTTFHQVSSDQASNRAVLREGVVGVKCVDVGSPTAVRGSVTPEQVEALARMDNVLMKMVGVKMGTVEVYENGALNVYLKDEKGVIGYVTYRP